MFRHVHSIFALEQNNQCFHKHLSKKVGSKRGEPKQPVTKSEKFYKILHPFDVDDRSDKIIEHSLTCNILVARH